MKDKDKSTTQLLEELIILRQELNKLRQNDNVQNFSQISYRELFDRMSDGVAVYEVKENGEDFIFSDFNKAAEKIEGLKKEDIIGKNLLEVFPGVKEFGFLDVFQRVWRTGIPEHYPVSMYKDSRIMGWRENYVYRLPNGQVVAVYDDITERKKAEEALEKYKDSLEEMIEDRTVNLKETNKKLSLNIEVRKQTEQELIKIKEVAENANKAKSEFLASMSHELRTPLNAILGFAQLLEMDSTKPLDELQQSAVTDIIQGGKHLLTLINDVLDLAKIEAGKSELVIKNIKITDIIDQSFTFIESIAADNNIKLNKAYDATDSVTVRADQTRTKQVLLNLLSNAVKYNFSGGTVTVSYHASSSDMLRIEVVDSGKGIVKARQNELFNPFNRLGAELSDVQGTGIGLSVSKVLVELMDGRIGFESNKNIGSTFWFELPMVENKLEETIAPSVKLLEKTTKNQPESIKMSLLYVEDNLPNIRLVEAICKPLEGTILTSVTSAEECIKIAKSIIPDIIIMDVNLPGMSGIEAMEYLRQDPNTAQIPVIGLSALAMKKDIDKGLNAGFSRYLTKPIDVNKLIRVLAELMQSGE